MEDSPRGRIIEEARNMFFSQGYSKVLMADLARRLSMSKKTLYQYFAGKEELLNVIISQHGSEIQREVELMLQNEHIAYPEKVKKIFTFIGSKLHNVTPFFVHDIKKNAPSGWEQLQRYKADAAFVRFSALLDEGARKGYIRKNANRSLAILLYASALDTILNPDFTRQVPKELVQQLPSTPAETFDGLVKIIFNGILLETQDRKDS